jgi:hypothetical protein
MHRFTRRKTWKITDMVPWIFHFTLCSTLVLNVDNNLTTLHEVTFLKSVSWCTILVITEYDVIYSSLAFVFNCCGWRYVVLRSCSPYFANVQTTTTTTQLNI